MNINTKMIISAIGISTVMAFTPVMADHHGGDKGQHKELRQKMKNMSKEERQAFIKTLPAEQQEKMQKRKAEHKELRAKMKGMSKEERKAYVETLPQKQQDRIKKHRKMKKHGKKNSEGSIQKENGLNIND